MSYCKALIANFWSSGTVSALSETPALPASFSKSPERTAIYRSLSQTADQYLLCDFGSIQGVNFLAIANLKTQNNGSVELYEGGSGTTPGAYNLVCTLGAYNLETRLASAFFDTVTARHWKLLFINGDSLVSDYVETGYVGLGPAMAQTRDCEPEITFEKLDPSTLQQSVDGQKSFTSRTPYYMGSLSFDFVLEADRNLLDEAFRTVSKQIPFFFMLDTDISSQQWLLRFGESLRTTRRGGEVPIYRVSFDWEEAR